MSFTRLDETRDYGFADKALALRERAGLTQRALAALLGVSGRAIQAWEAGLSYPGAERLKQLITLYVERSAFPVGREEDEAAGLWEAVHAHAPRHTVPFDRSWFASLRSGIIPVVGLDRSYAAPSTRASRRDDWGEAPDASAFYGRNQEMATLSRWLLDEHCRIIAVLGIGGIGKTLLSVRLAREVAPQCAVVYWRSLRNAPPVEEWLAGAIAALSAAQALPPDGLTARLGLLLDLLRERRGLLVLDNVESLLEPGAEARYREGYAGYGEVLRRVGETIQQGCLLLTGREAPPELAPMATERGPVRTLRLGGLGREAGRALLQDRGLVGEEAAWDALVARYSGNPMALSIVGETISAVFGGDIATFLAQDTVVFGNIRQLLDGQAERLSPLERMIGTCLAVEREPVGFAELVADLGPEVPRGEVVGAVEALLRRSLLERGIGGTFTLQPVVHEYVTARLMAQVYDEVLTGEPALLVRQPLLKAHAKDFVRRSQERLIAQLLERLRSHLGSVEAVEQRLRALLDAWRGQPPDEQGYGPGNVLNLLRLLRGELRGLDFSHLAIRQAYLQGVEAHDVSLAGAQLSAAMLDEAFNYPTAIALNGDSSYLAIGTSTGEVCLWRVADRTLLLALQGHNGAALGVGLSGDGRLIASGSYDGTVRLREAAGGRLLATLQGHTSGVRHVALSGNGRLVASGSQDGTVKLWEAMNGRLLATLQGHTNGVRDVALSGDGQLVASGSYDGTIKLWEATGGRLLATLHGEASGVWGLALSADGEVVASGSQDGMVRLWESSGGQLLATLQGHTGAVPSVALSADGHLIASGSFDGTVKLWEVPALKTASLTDVRTNRSRTTGRLLATLQGHTNGVWGVALSGDGRLAASASYDGTVKLWEVPSGQLLTTLEGQTSGVWSVALSGDGRLVASSSWDGSVRLWDTPSGRLLATLLEHTGAVPGVALSRDGRLMASGSFDGTARLWEASATETGPPEGARAGQGMSLWRPLETLLGHTGAVHAVALSGDRRRVASGSLDATVKLWEVPGGQLLATLVGHTGGVYSVALSDDGHLVASGSFDGTIRLWEAPVTGTGRSESPVRLLVTLEGHSSGVHAVALSGDGHVVASGSLDRTVKLWEVASGRLLGTLEGHSSGVYSVALSGDGRLLASGSFDGTVRLWEVLGGQLLTILHGHTTAVRSVALSRDGRLVVSGSYDGSVRLWDTRSGRLLSTLRGDRTYERMDITGLGGVTEAQRAALLALGAFEQEADAATSARTGPPPQAASARASAPVPTPAQPLAAADARSRPSTNLPLARTTFVGRAVDVETLTQSLVPTAGAGTRLLTLSGVAGCGKTRLALAVADARHDAYADGVWLVELAPLPASTSPDLTAVAAATLAALVLHEQPSQALLDTLVTHLQPRRLLLVLDNCEHVVAACAALAARLLETCPELQILATSQQALGIANETVWPVSPLVVPPAVDGPPTPELLSLVGQSEAVQMFVERARTVQPRFTLDTTTAASVAAICRQLDGLPLALELAAARLHMLPVEELLARLDDRFRLLRRGGRSTTDRHQTLQATMDWSYGLLIPAEQALLRRLAVFAGGCEVAVAEAVCAGEEVAVEAVLELLDELLERSLVYMQHSTEAPRYGLLETMRQYGLQQLERTGELAVVRDRHLHWCVTLAEKSASALQGPDQAAWLARLAREHDNLRAALQWALDRGDNALGLRLAAGLWQFWRSRSHLSEGRRWLAALLALPAEHEDATSLTVRANALEGAAWLTEDEHEFAQASALFAQSNALRRALGQDGRTTGLLINAAMEARAGGDYAQATALLEESLAQLRARGNRESIKRGGLGLSLARLALVLAEQGQQARATALYEECLALHRELGDREGIGNALLGLGDVARDLGDTARVRAYCEETLSLFRELGHTWVGFSLNNLALAACLDGDLALAAQRAEESVALFRGLHAGPSLAEVLVTLGRVRGAQGAAAAAYTHLSEALALAWAKGPRFVVAAALDELGVLSVQQGKVQHGVHLLGAATALRRAMGTPARPADRPMIGAALSAARTSLGDGPFEDAWSTGQGLPVDQIIAKAVAGQEDGPAKPDQDGIAVRPASNHDDIATVGRHS